MSKTEFVIRPETHVSGGSSVRISDNLRPKANQTYLAVDRGKLPNGQHGGSGYTALDQHEAFEVIKAIATTSGLLYDQHGRMLYVKEPAPKKTPQEIAEENRRKELNNMQHSDLLDLVVSLEKEGGRL